MPGVFAHDQIVLDEHDTGRRESQGRVTGHFAQDFVQIHTVQIELPRRAQEVVLRVGLRLTPEISDPSITRSHKLINNKISGDDDDPLP